MTQKQKQLLLKDLCGRLPYGVKINIEYYDLQGDGELKNRNIILSQNNIGYCFQNSHWVSFKPYLRPMSSMTDKENEELKYVIELGLQALEGEEGHNTVSAAPAAFEVDFYNKHHFDYRGLIPMGLALEASDDMYK